MPITLSTIDAGVHSIKISDGTDTLAVNADGSLNATVTATDLDIRDLDHASDSVKVGDGTDFLEINADGSLNATVSATDLDIRDLSHAQDSVKIGDGTDFLAVNADGSINVMGALTVSPDSFSTWKTTNQAVTTSASQLAATPLAGRDSIIIQNVGAVSVYVGPDNSVTSSNGLEIPGKSSQEIALGDDADLWAITASGSSNVRLAEYAL